MGKQRQKEGGIQTEHIATKAGIITNKKKRSRGKDGTGGNAAMMHQGKWQNENEEKNKKTTAGAEHNMLSHLLPLIALLNEAFAVAACFAARISCARCSFVAQLCCLQRRWIVAGYIWF
jgi:hypothetical protein